MTILLAKRAQAKNRKTTKRGAKTKKRPTSKARAQKANKDPIAKSQPQKKPEPDWQPILQRLNAEWDAILQDLQKPVERMITFGVALEQVKRDLKHGEFMKVKEKLWCGARMAEKLMAVARNLLLSDSKYASILPASWDTRYELTRLDKKCGEGTLKQKLDDGSISLKTTRKQVVEWMRPESKEDDAPEKPNLKHTTTQTRRAYLDFLRARTPVQRYAELMAFRSALGPLGLHIEVSKSPPIIEAQAQDAAASADERKALYAGEIESSTEYEGERRKQ